MGMSASQLLRELDAASGVLVRPSNGYPWVWYSRRSGAHLRASNPEMQIIDLALIVAAIEAAERVERALAETAYQNGQIDCEVVRLRHILAALVGALAKETTE